MKIKLVVVVLLLAVVFGGIYGWHRFIGFETQKFFSTYKPAPAYVSVDKAVAENWPVFVESTGSLRAKQGVDITPEVSGKITQIFFHSGQTIKAGDPIVQLNPDLLQAQLADNKAQLELTQSNYQRQKTLYASSVAAQSDLDQAKAQYDEAIASVAQTSAQLSQTLVRAPFDGVLGLRQVNLGQYIQPGNPIVNLQMMDPMEIDFAVPENALANLTASLPIDVHIIAYPSMVFHGEVFALNSTITNTNRTLNVRGSVGNKDNVLKPGMFAVVDVIFPQTIPVISIPQIAVSYSSVGDYVYVVEGDKAKRAYVTLGERKGDRVAVLKGLKGGEQVVYAGQVKLNDGASVTIEQEKKP